MKKLPGYVYALIGAGVAVVGLYFWGKASMKKESGAAGTGAANTGTTAPTTETKKTLSGGVLRSNN